MIFYTGFERKDAEHIMNKFSNKGWDSIIDEAVDYQNKVMRHCICGIMSRNTATTLLVQVLPVHVLMDEKNMPKLGKSMEARDPIYRIKGHSENTIDPFESIIKNTIVYTAMAEQNMVGRAYLRLAKNYDGTGKFFDIVPPRMIGKSFQIGEIEKVLQDAGADTDNIDLEALATIFRPTGYTAKDNVIRVFEDGKPKYIEVFEPEMYKAFKSMDAYKPDAIIKLLSIPSRLRAGATGLNMDFIGRNPIRDTVLAGITSRYRFIPFLDSIKSLAHIYNQDEVYQRWLYSGAANSELASVDRDSLQARVEKVLR